MTSVSVSERNVLPCFSKNSFSGRKFSMMPLCTMQMLPFVDICGCAFSSEGAPCVAQRVWPMPR